MRRSSAKGSPDMHGLPRQEKRRQVAAPLIAALLCALTLYPAAAWSAADQLRDLRGPLPAAGLPPFALSLLLLLTAGWAGAVCFRAWRRPAPLAPCAASDPINPTDPAGSLLELSLCYRSGAFGVETLCQQLAALLRSELGRRSGVAAQGLTSEELLQLLGAGELAPPDEIAVAGRLLHLCDQVKFAGYRPEQAQTEWLLAAAERLLEQAREGRHEVS